MTGLREIAATLLSAPAADVVFADGRVRARGRSGEGLPFCEVVAKAYYERVPLFATGFYRTPEIHFDWKTGQGKPFHYFAYGAAVSEVEVDGFTGEYRLLRVDILHDVGDSLSPLVDRGQVEGGFVQGVGWLTSEELVWGADGAFLSHGASTYKLPTLGECPLDLRVALPRARRRARRRPRQQGGGRAAADAGDQRSRSAARRDRGVRLRRDRRARFTRDAGSGVLGHRARPRVCDDSGVVSVGRLRSRESR